MRRCLSALVMVGISSLAISCDNCSISSTGDILLRQNTLSYVFRLREMRTMMPFDIKSSTPKHLGHLEETTGDVRELYLAHELRGSWAVGYRWTILASLPVVRYKDLAVDLRFQKRVYATESQQQMPTTQRLIAEVHWILQKRIQLKDRKHYDIPSLKSIQ